ncbi:MAG: hypothetical protein EAZ11_07815 [Curvibacter sp.]|nr:MAG: hypothetical protein EAZ11_07815 [Curvibacter sp.]
MARFRAIRFLWFSWILFGAGWSCAADVLILSSERSPTFSEASEAAVNELVRLGIRRTDIAQLQVSELKPGYLGVAQGAKVWITLGSAALAGALQREERPVLVSALIPRLGFERLLREHAGKSAAQALAVYLDQPFGRQLDLVRLALPEARKVGALWGPESIAQQAGLQSAAQSRGMRVVAGGAIAPGALFEGLKPVLEDADVLLAVADPQVFNGATISNILLATYRDRMPVIAFSPGYVKAGALMAVYSTPRQIGLQAGAMARAVAQGGVMPTSQYPADFSVVVNQHVARSLGLVLDEASLNQRMQRLEGRP